MDKKLIAYEISDFYLPKRIVELDVVRERSPKQPRVGLDNGLPCIWAESLADAVMQIQLHAMLNGVEPMTVEELSNFKYATPGLLRYRALSSKQMNAVVRAMQEWAGRQA